MRFSTHVSPFIGRGDFDQVERCFGLRLAAIVRVGFNLRVEVLDESRISFVDCGIELRQQRIERFGLLDRVVRCTKCFAFYSAWQISFSCSGSE